MTKRTEREFHIALGKLLDRVRFQNSWNAESFINAATHVKNVSKSEAARFYKALVDMNLLIPGTDKRRLMPNFDVIIWKNEDKRIGLIREILEMYPNILQKKGRVKGKHYSKVTEETIEVIVDETISLLPDLPVHPLDAFHPRELVEYLRSKNWHVDAYREEIVITRL